MKTEGLETLLAVTGQASYDTIREAALRDGQPFGGDADLQAYLVDEVFKLEAAGRLGSVHVNLAEIITGKNMSEGEAIKATEKAGVPNGIISWAEFMTGEDELPWAAVGDALRRVPANCLYGSFRDCLNAHRLWTADIDFSSEDQQLVNNVVASLIDQDTERRERLEGEVSRRFFRARSSVRKSLREVLLTALDPASGASQETTARSVMEITGRTFEEQRDSEDASFTDACVKADRV